jgi:hypothetical protein
MKPVTFRTRGANESADAYLRRALDQIADASLEDALPIADAFTVTNFTASYALNAGTATTAQLANFVATFINDLKRRGKNRTQ